MMIDFGFPCLQADGQGHYAIILVKVIGFILTKVIGGGFLSRHRHPAPVHGFVIKGSWRYLEHDWVATEGSYLFEPPGEIHTLVVDDDCEEMITLFHNTGALIYCDENGNTIGSTDVFDRIESRKKTFYKCWLRFRLCKSIHQVALILLKLLYRKYPPDRTNIDATTILTGLSIKNKGNDRAITEIGT